jgi:hypothetical protein
MRTFAGLCLSYALAACTFEPAPLAGDPGPSPGPDAAGAVDATAPGAAPDAAVDTGPDAAAADAGPPAAFCDPADPALVGCFRFEDTTDDASSSALAIIATAVGFDEGMSGRAAVFTAASALHVVETPALDLAAVTMEMWVRPDALPVAPARAGLFDNSGQYSMFIFGNATVRCSGNGEALVAGALAAGVWTHVACVHDGQSINLFIDGMVAATGAAGAINQAATSGSNIGSDNPGGGDDFIGRIDELRIWNRARTPAEICAAAACPAR